MLGSDQDQYTLYGHSAGSQFVHRYLYYKPDARVKQYLAANAGWYTLPDFNTKYPYGLGDAGIGARALSAALGKNVVLLLGREDTDYNDPDLRKTPEAAMQGLNRFTRGHEMFYRARERAQASEATFNWRLVIVDEAGHVNAQMARTAAAMIE
jgi:pimeloyl-ACP methyl ester carboxylesterase